VFAARVNNAGTVLAPGAFTVAGDGPAQFPAVTFNGSYLVV
jgi:hypothetical protein